jgi:hypothetical protein
MCFRLALRVQAEPQAIQGSQVRLQLLLAALLWVVVVVVKLRRQDLQVLPVVVRALVQVITLVDSPAVQQIPPVVFRAQMVVWDIQQVVRVVAVMVPAGDLQVQRDLPMQALAVTAATGQLLAPPCFMQLAVAEVPTLLQRGLLAEVR